jgi:hypothetical protein
MRLRLSPVDIGIREILLTQRSIVIFALQMHPVRSEFPNPHFGARARACETFLRTRSQVRRRVGVSSAAKRRDVTPIWVRMRNFCVAHQNYQSRRIWAISRKRRKCVWPESKLSTASKMMILICFGMESKAAAWFS